ncbi:MAG: HlyD family efflux transporter periplasmic adaptor subunit [Bacteroidetes bacterium]|nr:HlyD family efflux transporter periplasmic adaptor subunit [Bacteroidota bacterium]
MILLNRYHLFLLLSLCLISCNNNEDTGDEQSTTTETPVTVDTVKQLTMATYVHLNATAVFLQKNIVKANAAGYVQSVNIHMGDYVGKGTLLFRIKTKEAQSIGNTINKLDSTFKFTGINDIKATKGGYVSQINHQLGDYVQDGEQLATITDTNSFAFLLNVPYELHQYVNPGRSVSIKLPDQTIVNGFIASAFPTVDSQSQAQTFVIRTDHHKTIPENLVASVEILKEEQKDATSVPKSAVLSDDTQTNFWIMKLIDSNTAVKVYIKKQLETSDRVEVQSPTIRPSDIVLVSGNFGLPDTAKVKVMNK